MALSFSQGEVLPAHGRPSSIFQALLRAVETFPTGGYTFIDASGQTRSQSYEAMLERALRVSMGLRRAGVESNDRVIIRLDDPCDFIAALWAILVTGAFAVPFVEASTTVPATPTRLDELFALLDNPWVIEDREEASHGIRRGLNLVELERSEPWEDKSGEACESGVLIPTSGTTGHPNLVQLDPHALLYRWWPPRLPVHEDATTLLSWMPLDHVMGLSFAGPNFARKVHLATARFVAAPASWLNAVEAFEVTHAPMPTFGLALLEKTLRSPALTSWNLSTIRHLGIGAEPVSPRLCKRFLAQARPFGLRDDVLHLGYGLTECGPVVGGRDHFGSWEGNDLEPFAVLGLPSFGHAVRIVDAADQVLPEGIAGAVEVRGPSMTSGYYGDPEGTARLFTSDGWIRTGDLGKLRQGRLTITGREKEILSIRARKVSCVAVEDAACAIPNVEIAYATSYSSRPDTGPAPGDHFALFFVAALDDPVQLVATARRLRATIAKRFGMAPAVIVPIAAAEVPRTSSGKAQRLELAARLERGEFDQHTILSNSSLAADCSNPTPASSTSLERQVHTAWTRVLGQQQFGPDDDFFEIGGDSLRAMQLIAELEALFTISLPDHFLIDHASIRQMSRFLAHHSSCPLAVQDASRVPSFKRDDAPLVAVQGRITTFTANWPGERCGKRGLLLAHNKGGLRRPLFWCLQTEEEMSQLARRLGDNQPLFALRSAYLAMTYTRASVQALAARYVEDMLSVDGGPYLIGGNCQGGLIALEMARQLQRSGYEVQLLTLMDMPFWEVFEESYPGRVALFAGAKSRFNPLRRFRYPELGYRKLFPMGVSFEVLPALYGRFFEDHVLDAFIPKWSAALEAGQGGVQLSSGELPKSAYSARIHAPKIATVNIGESITLDVRVENVSFSAWGRTPDTGLMIGSHWLTATGEMIAWGAGYAELQQNIAPGEASQLALTIRAPMVPGEYVLEIDMVEAGIAWFSEKASWPAFVPVTVGPPSWEEIITERDDLARRCQELQSERDTDRAHLSAILLSKSWRFSAPLRKAIDAMRRQRRRLS